jgi:hypothetical protein
MRQFLNRRFAAAVLTVVVLAVFSAPAFAGGAGGSKSKVNVRVKNFTLESVSVAVANKNPTALRGLNPDQVTQFKVNKGGFGVRVTYLTTSESASFNTGSRKTVYIAITDLGIEDTTTRF